MQVAIVVVMMEDILKFKYSFQNTLLIKKKSAGSDKTNDSNIMNETITECCLLHNKLDK